MNNTMNNASGDLFLCLDQGGHASRAALFDSAGRMQSFAIREIATHRDHGDDNHVEHAPQELLDSLRQAADEVIAGLGTDSARVIAAGLATQRSSIVCWHRETGKPLTPVISWQDRRAADWLKQFADHEARIHAITGLVLSPHYGVSKLRWCLDNVPAVSRAQAEGKLVFGPLAAWLANGLCDQAPTLADPANASRTLLWDRQTLDWSEELLQLFGIPRDCLPTSVPSRYEWGTLVCDANEIPLQIVTGDQSAALFAFGQPQADTVYANMGTGVFLQRCMRDPLFDPDRLLASVVYQDGADAMSVLEATVNGAGSAINKFAAEVDMDMARVKTHSAEWLKRGSDLPLFVNAVSGLGSPWWLPDMESRFVGEGNDEQKMAAIMESIAFMVAVNLQAGNRVAGDCQQIVVSGGLGSVDPLLQRIADLSAATVVRAEVREATVRGLAFLLAGMPQNWPGVTSTDVFMPKENTALMERFRQWCELMPALG
jgi:glycerol kinase